MIGQDLPLEMKMHNIVQQCKKCKKWVNLKLHDGEKMYGVMTVSGVGQAAPGMLALGTNLITICETCFKDLECTDRDSGLVVATQPLPDLSKIHPGKE